MRKIITTTFLALLVWLCAKPVSAQVSTPKSSILLAKEATAELNQYIDDVNRLDQTITKSLIGHFTSSDIDKYDRRLREAEELLEKLENINKIFINLSEKSPGEKDYYIKSVFTKLTMLSLVSRRTDYLEYLKITAQASEQRLYSEGISYKERLKQYQAKTLVWADKEEILLRSASLQLKKALNIDENNLDARICNAILLFYQKKSPEAIEQFKTLIAGLESQKSDEKKANNSSLDKYVGYLQSWLAYIHLTNNNISECIKAGQACKIINEPEKSAHWSNVCLVKIENKNLKSHEIGIKPIEIPGNAFCSWNGLSYELNEKKNKIVTIKSHEKDTTLVRDPLFLVRESKSAWAALAKLDEEPWMANANELETKQKKAFKDAENMYVDMTTVKSSGTFQKQSIKQLERYKKAVEIANRFSFVRSGFSNFIKTNPEIVSYRIGRIKANLGLYYFEKNAEQLISFYDRIKTKEFKKLKLAELNNNFNTSVLSEINQDIAYFEKHDPENLLYLVTKAEVIAYTDANPYNAITRIDEISAKIPKTALVINEDPAVMLEVYKSYVYLRMKDIKKLRQSVQLFEGNPAYNTYAKNLKRIANYLEHEEKTLDKNVKFKS